jgi:hypothetical protein
LPQETIIGLIRQRNPPIQTSNKLVRMGEVIGKNKNRKRKQVAQILEKTSRGLNPHL